MAQDTQFKPNLGTAVEYRDSKGRSKAAFAVGTPDTCDGALALEANELHLFIASLAGSAYFRQHANPARRGRAARRQW
jgi:hypothetical protein